MRASRLRSLAVFVDRLRETGSPRLVRDEGRDFARAAAGRREDFFEPFREDLRADVLRALLFFEPLRDVLLRDVLLRRVALLREPLRDVPLREPLRLDRLGERDVLRPVLRFELLLRAADFREVAFEPLRDVLRGAAGLRDVRRDFRPPTDIETEPSRP